MGFERSSTECLPCALAIGEDRLPGTPGRIDLPLGAPVRSLRVVAIHTTGNFINRGVRLKVYDQILDWTK
jgi:hypothetical protein